MDIDPSPPPPGHGGTGIGIGIDVASSPSSSPPSLLPPPRMIKIHPLAIIGISDHHTRVVSGGSALSRSSPVMGLLFGSSSDKEVSVVDAEEMECPTAGQHDDDDPAARRASIVRRIELHRRVFPTHEVVGWYRVADATTTTTAGKTGTTTTTTTPTREDLHTTMTEIRGYRVAADDGYGPLFVLVDASSSSSSSSSSRPDARKPSSMSTSLSSTTAMEEDEELPLTVYETLGGTTITRTDGGPGEEGAAFVGADFALETDEPERIAVERVFRTRVVVATTSSGEGASSTTAVGTGGGGEGVVVVGGPRKTGKKSRKDGEEGRKGRGQSSSSSSSSSSSERPRFERGPTDLDEHLESMESSVRAMNLRIGVLCEYLTRVERGEIDANDAILRSIDGLVSQLPLILASLEGGRASSSSSSSADVDDAGYSGGRTPLRELENEYGNATLLAYLAAVAKTARAVHVYSEKFRNACESGKTDPHRRPHY